MRLSETTRSEQLSRRGHDLLEQKGKMSKTSTTRSMFEVEVVSWLVGWFIDRRATSQCADVMPVILSVDSPI
jgi:hypothetical protein